MIHLTILTTHRQKMSIQILCNPFKINALKGTPQYKSRFEVLKAFFFTFFYSKRLNYI
jgi:hypothetical protein